MSIFGNGLMCGSCISQILQKFRLAPRNMKSWRWSGLINWLSLGVVQTILIKQFAPRTRLRLWCRSLQTFLLLPTPTQLKRYKVDMTETIPSPPSYPIVGNVLDIDPKSQVKSLCRMAEVYGPIYRLHLPQGNLILLASYELVNEICDEKQFVKCPSGPLVELKAAMRDGLFTADYGNHEWGIAHRILMPAFGRLALRHMFDEMHEIAGQLVMKWARCGPANRINVTSDFTRLTLDSIADSTASAKRNSISSFKP